MSDLCGRWVLLQRRITSERECSLPAGHEGACENPGHPVEASEHQRVQAELEQRTAEAAAMRERLNEHMIAESPDPECAGQMICECGELAATPEQIAHAADCPLSSSAGAALLEEMEGLRAQREAMTDNCHRLISERDAARAESADLRKEVAALEQRESQHRERAKAAEAVSSNLRARLEAAEGAAKSSHAVVEQMRTERTRLEAYVQRLKRATAAEVRRAVEEEREACAVVADGLGCVGVGFAIRARGKEPKK